MQCEKQENIDDSKEIQWTTYTKLDGLAGNSVGSIAIDKAGNKWFGTNQGVSKFDGNTWTTYTTSDGLISNYVDAIAVDNEGNKWFLSYKGISKFDGNTWTNYMPSFIHQYFIRSIAIDAQDILWFGTNGKGVYKFNGTTWINYTISDGLVSNYVDAIAVDKKGNMWFGTGEGVSKFDGNRWTNYAISDGLASNNVYTIAVDKKGNMWFSTCEGVSRFDGKKWTNYILSNFTISDGYGHIIGIAIDAQDILWVLRRFEESFDIPAPTTEGGLTGAIVNSWEWGEIIFFDGKKWTTVYNGYIDKSWGDEGSYLNGLLFNSIVIDKENNKWLGTNGGVIKLSD